MTDIQNRTFQVPLTCHYLVKLPDVVDAKTPLVLTLHGFSSNPEIMLRLTARLFDRPAVIVAMQGPYQFFLQEKSRDVGYGWITSRFPQESIRLHHEMVLHVLDEVGRDLGIASAQRILTGFSQSVGLNYRFAATHPEAVRGVVAICGGMPSDWETGLYQLVTAAILHIARREDEFYAPSVTEEYPARLQQRAADVEFHQLDGGHQIPSSGNQVVGPWLERVLGGV